MITIMDAFAAVPFPEQEDIRNYSKLQNALVVYLRSRGTPVHVFRHEGGVPQEFLDRFMEECGYKITISFERTVFNWDRYKKEDLVTRTTNMMVLNDNILVVPSDMGGEYEEPTSRPCTRRTYDFSFAFVGKAPTELETEVFQRLTSEYLKRPRPSISTIGTFSVERGNLTIGNLELPAIQYQTENYSGDINNWWTKLETSINDDTKLKGKLTILQGPPGCGKTMFLRSMLSHFKDNERCKFIYVPLSVAVRLSSPETVPILKLFRDKKIILVIEDADMMLEDRAKGGNGPISEFLNVTDGILGAALNLHVVVTTNLTKTEFDPAITRPGRLQSLLQFSELSAEHAARIYKRETGNVLKTSKETYSLAEIYALAIEETNGVTEKKRVASGQYL